MTNDADTLSYSVFSFLAMQGDNQIISSRTMKNNQLVVSRTHADACQVVQRDTFFHISKFFAI